MEWDRSLLPVFSSPLHILENEHDLINCFIWTRAYLACEMKPKGVTRIAGMFGRRLLIATTETGELLLYTLPLPKDSKAPVWEEHINAGKN